MCFCRVLHAVSLYDIEMSYDYCSWQDILSAWVLVPWKVYIGEKHNWHSIWQLLVKWYILNMSSCRLREEGGEPKYGGSDLSACCQLVDSEAAGCQSGGPCLVCKGYKYKRTNTVCQKAEYLFACCMMLVRPNAHICQSMAPISTQYSSLCGATTSFFFTFSAVDHLCLKAMTG